MEPSEESVGSCALSPGGCAEATCGCAPAPRWTMSDLDCPLMEPLPRVVREFYEEQRRVQDAWEAEIDRRIAEVEWARKHPEEAARRAVERHLGGAGPAGPYFGTEGWEPEMPEIDGYPLPPLNLCEVSPCTDAQNAVDHLVWNPRVAVDSERAADLVGNPRRGQAPSAPVAYNGGKWMAVDARGRAFVVHLRGARIRLLVFDANNPSTVYMDRLIDPATVDPDVLKVAAPCIAVSSTGSSTTFTIAFLGSPVQALIRVYVCRGRINSWPLMSSLSIQRLTQVSLGTLANPAVFHDNLNNVHLVVAFAPGPPIMGAQHILWFCTPWIIPFNGQSVRAELRLGLTLTSPGFPSVAARWDNGRLTVVVGCKFEGATGRTGVYANGASGGSISGLSWTGWNFLAGVDVYAGVNAGFNAGDPSVWVNECGRFYIGYHEQVIVQGVLHVKPVISSNPYPVERPTSWSPQMLSPSAHSSQFVHVAGSEEYAFAVWEARIPGGDRAIIEPTWAAAVGTHSVGRSGVPDWGIVEPTTGWGLDLRFTGADMLLFPTCQVVGDEFFAAWLYMDRLQLQVDDNALSDLDNWGTSTAFAEIYFMRGVIRCP